MKLQFLGCGDAFGSGGRLNSCFFVENRSAHISNRLRRSGLIAIRRFGIDPNRIGTVFVSHLHADHFGGLPFLLLDAQLYSRRNAPLTLVGPPGFHRRLMEAMELFFPGSSTVQRKFSAEIREIGVGETNTINGISVTTYLVEHASGAFLSGTRSPGQRALKPGAPPLHTTRVASRTKLRSQFAFEAVVPLRPW